jgi:probable rRNA maturation factor
VSYQIDIRNETDTPLSDDTAEAIKQAARITLKQQEAAPDSTLSVVLTDNDTVQRMNREYRDTDAPTDVLSFPADPLPPELDAAPYLGDLIVAVPYAKAQATHHGHNWRESLSLLVVHGTLHLLGYDHDTPPSRAAMWQAQDDALNALGIDSAIVPSLEDSDH